MKTNILWKNERIVGTITSSQPPTFSMLQPKHLKAFGEHLSFRSQPEANKREEFTDADGGVFGVRFFNFYPSSSGKGFLVSPSSNYVWESLYATTQFLNREAVRGHKGFHAAWPRELRNWTSVEIDHHDTGILALVKGYGDMVLGDMGWRSEKMEILQLVTRDLATTEAINARYPGKATTCNYLAANRKEVEFSITWTPEFTEQVINKHFPPPKPRLSTAKVMANF